MYPNVAEWAAIISAFLAAVIFLAAFVLV